MSLKRPLRSLNEQWLAFGFAAVGLGIVIAAGCWGAQLLSDNDLEFSGSLRLMALTSVESDVSPNPGLRPTVRLLVSDPTSESPLVELQVVTECGQGSSQGALILEGDARLSDINLGAPPAGIGGEVVTVEHLDPILRDPSVQVIIFMIPELSCPDGFDVGAVSTARWATGLWDKPVVELQGPRSSASGPRMRSGDFGDLDTLQSTLPENGTWAIWGPGDFVYRVEFELTSSQQMVGTPAHLDGTNPLHWSGGQLSPQVEWTDAEGGEQRSLTFLIIGLVGGVGGSMVVTGSFEGFRRLLTPPNRECKREGRADEGVQPRLFDSEEE